MGGSSLLYCCASPGGTHPSPESDQQQRNRGDEQQGLPVGSQKGCQGLRSAAPGTHQGLMSRKIKLHNERGSQKTRVSSSRCCI